jgi:hypothetical protein
VIKIPTYTQDYEKVKEAAARAGQLNQESADLSAGAETFSDRVMKNVMLARANRGVTKLQEGVGSAMGQLASEPAAMRERMANVNPLQTDTATAQQRGITLNTLGTSAELAQGTSGNISDIIGAGANQIKAQALLKQAEAEKAANEADDLMAWMEFQAKREEEKFQRTVTERELVLKGKESGGDDISDLMGGEGDGIQTPNPTEEQPRYSPTMNGETGAFSNGGEWYFDRRNSLWRPVTVIGTGPDGTVVQFDNGNDPDIDTYEAQGYKIETRLY